MLVTHRAEPISKRGGHIESFLEIRDFMATYASTGAAGVNVEVDYAALLAVCLVAERGDRALPPGALPWRLSLQRRDGPAGFDDIVVEWRRESEAGVTFVQSKRAFSV